MTNCSSTQRKKRKMGNNVKLQGLGGHDEFLSRIKKSLYYGEIPITDGLSLPVTELAAELFSEVKKECSLDRLYIDQAANISHNACVSPCSLVLALLYLERLKTCNSEYVEKVAPSELFLVSMMVASKFLHDDGEDDVFNDEWATSAGIDLKDMNRLEKEFLSAINWEVYVSEQAFWARLHVMEATLALREGKRRGWFSYSELTHLIRTVELLSLAHTFITMSAVCLTSYTASVLAMVGSTLVVSQMPGVTTSLVASTLTSSSPVSTVPVPLPFATPETCLTTNETLFEDITSLEQTLHHWHESDINNHSFPEMENDSLADLNSFHLKRKREWSEQKDWLTTITELVQVASTNIHPTMAMPVDTLLY